MLGNRIYLPGDTIFISDIGPQPGNRSDPGSTLVCVTTYVNMECCRKMDNLDNVRKGNWFNPDNQQVPTSSSATSNDILVRVGWLHQIRLAKNGNAIQCGLYKCEVPKLTDNSILISASIYLSGENYRCLGNISMTYCNVILFMCCDAHSI